MLRDAAALLRGVLNLLRTGRQAHGKQRQSNETSQSHGVRASSRPSREPMKRECQIPNSTEIYTLLVIFDFKIERSDR